MYVLYCNCSRYTSDSNIYLDSESKKIWDLAKKNHQYLSSGGHVELLDDVVEEGNGYNDDDKDRHGKDNSHHGAEHRQQLIEQLTHVHRHGRVDNVDVLGESVQNAAYR